MRGRSLRESSSPFLSHRTLTHPLPLDPIPFAPHPSIYPLVILFFERLEVEKLFHFNIIELPGRLIGNINTINNNRNKNANAFFISLIEIGYLSFFFSF